MKNFQPQLSWLWAFIIFLIPWQARWIFAPAPTEYATLSLYAIDVLLIIALIFSRFWKQCHQPLTLSYWIVSVFIILTAIVALSPILAIYKIIEVALIVVAILVIGSDLNKQQLDFYRGAFIVSVFLQSILGLGEFIWQQVPANTWLGMAGQDPLVLGTSVVAVGGVRWLRAYGSFPHPNIYGAFLILGLFFIVDWLATTLRERNKEESWFAVIFFIVVGFGAAVSVSRTAILALVFGLLIYFYQQYRIGSSVIKKVLIRVMGSIIAICVIITIVFPDVWVTRLRGESRLEEQSRQDREIAYGEAWQVFRANPLFGTGLGNYTVALEKLNPEKSSYEYQPVHNAYILLIVELGLMGTVLLLYILRRSLVLIWKNFGNAPPIALAFIVAFFVLASFDHYLWSLHAGLIFWILFAILGVGFRLPEKKN